MASNTLAFAVFLIFNVLFFTFATACGTCCTSTSCPPTPPNPTPIPSPSSAKCPIDALKLAVCADVLGGLLNIVIGTPPKEPCCSLLSGLVDLEVAVCLCTAIKANILGIINLNIPIDLTLLVNYCGKNVPSGFQCPN